MRALRSVQSGAGFSLIEALISLALLGTLAALAIVGLQTLRRGDDVTSASRKVMAALQLAHSRTLASTGDTQYGVHFDSSQYVVFTGSTYNPAAGDNEAHAIGTGLELRDITLGGGGDDVIFDRITGTTSQAGSITVGASGEPDTEQTITILGSGLVGLEESVAPTGTRVTDSRHLHFDLSWSLNDVSTLQLIFSDPDFTHEVTMADHYAADGSFDWEDTVTVGGSGQTLRVHTHALDGASTLLSIHRDRRYNDTALTMAFDGYEVVSYTAGGTAAVGADGGTMTPQ